MLADKDGRKSYGLMMPIENYEHFWNKMLHELASQGFRNELRSLKNDAEFVSVLSNILSIGHKN
jgi:hypothetical protein